MTEPDKDLGIAMALCERFTNDRLPRALGLREKVGGGELLDDFDIAFLREVFDSAEDIKPLIDRHAEFQDIYAQAVALYHEITARALANEQAGNSAG